METIKDFTIRGGYPNLRSTFRNMEYRFFKKGGMYPELPGYFPPGVIYSTGKRHHRVTVRDFDLPFLSEACKEEAINHLSMILRAREGDARIIGELLKKGMGYYRRSLELFSDDLFLENDFIIPSSSRRTYSAEKVSHKGSILLKLSQQGYSVPDFVIMTSDTYVKYRDSIEEVVVEGIETLEKLTSRSINSNSDPLLIAIRCAMPQYFPGLMPTFLNVGITESTFPVFEARYGREVAARILLNNLKNIFRALDPTGYKGISHRLVPHPAPAEVKDLLRQITASIKKKDSGLLEDPVYQINFFVKLAYHFFEENQELLSTLSRGAKQRPSIIIQKMVCSVRNDRSYAGVVFSRHSMMGKGRQLETANDIFGEEIMTGTVETSHTNFTERGEIENSFPAVYHFLPGLDRLEREFQSPVTIEFAAESIKNNQFFALLQLNITEMTGRAAFISIIDLYKRGVISKKRVTELICPYHLKQMETDSIDDRSFRTLYEFSRGVHILPRSAVTARIYFSTEAALEAKRRGEKVCFCKKNFTPDDTIVMREMDAIVSQESAAIHVVTICQSFGVPALLNLEKFGTILAGYGKLINSSGQEINEGDWITISSKRQILYRGRARYKPARLMRYMRGEKVNLDKDEKEAFAAMSYAYREYQKLVKNLDSEHISTLAELIRLVNLELRGDKNKAREIVNAWFDSSESQYINEVLSSEMGDHLNQQSIYEMLSDDRKIKFFKKALEKCVRYKIFGYAAGAFMLGRFLCIRKPIAFWKSFSNFEIALLINEWILFEKYMQILYEVGEKKVYRFRQKFLKNELSTLYLHGKDLKSLMTLKLSGIEPDEVEKVIPPYCDRQVVRVLELLRKPYSAFYQFDAPWSIKELEGICMDENIPLPAPDDV